MFPLVESIKVFDSKVYNLRWHQRRFERSYRNYYNKEPKLNISDTFSIPGAFSSGLVKARFCYNDSNFNWEFHDYNPKVRKTLKIIHDNQIEYDLKYTDRSQLKKLHKKRDGCDDILIVKNGYITDTYSANIVFYTGQEWITPATPLLAGTCRARLLNSGQIYEEKIKISDLPKFDKFHLINAMHEFNEHGGEPISGIKI